LEKYKFIDHVADIAVEVYGNSIEELISKEFVERFATKIKISDKGEKFLKSISPEENSNQDNYEDILELYNKLRDARKEAAEKFQQSIYLICPDETLREIAEKKPTTETKLLIIQGFNQRMFNKIGYDFLEIIKEHLRQKENSQKENKLPANIYETYNLVLKGYKLEEICSLRKLSEAVISMQMETILEFYPDTGIGYLFSDNELNLINSEIAKGFSELKDLKENLPKSISFGKIRIAAAKRKFS